jgi:acyl-coenzyme A thioesterase PaaI-like protein
MRGAAYVGTMLAGEAPIPPVAQLIGMEMAAASPGRVVIELEAGKQHSSPLGTVHGGVLGAIADAAMGLA